MTSRSVSACALVVTLFSIVGVACADGAVEGPDRNLKSAGMLSESRLPYGIFGDSPAPTGGLPRDKSLEQGWFKRADKGAKAPTAGDRASLLASSATALVVPEAQQQFTLCGSRVVAGPLPYALGASLRRLPFRSRACRRLGR